MKKFLTLIGCLVLCSCATHATITMPSVQQVNSEFYANKKLSVEIFYSQPEPGMFNDIKQQPLKPIKEAKLSVASATTLQRLPEYIFKQLPPDAERTDKSKSDLNLRVELIAHHKRGPTFADFEVGKNLGKSLLTFGLGSSEYNIVADFDVTYILLAEENEVFKKKYTIKESVDHERGKFESISSVHDFAGQLLEKHLVLSLNNFLEEAAKSNQG